MIKRTNKRKTHSRTRFSAECVSCWKCVCVCRFFFRSSSDRVIGEWANETCLWPYAWFMRWKLRLPITATNARTEEVEEKKNRTLFEDKPQQTQKPITATITNGFWAIFLKCLFFVYVLFLCARAFALFDFSIILFFPSLLFFSFAVTSLNVSNVIALHSARLWSSMHTWCWA